MLWKEFKKPQNAKLIIDEINRMDIKQVKIMEICGTHTMSIAKSGIKSLLPKSVAIISGPGCPVCVTPSEAIDEILKLAGNKDIIIATYGDMLKVPGLKYGENLEKLKALGANVEMVYSAMDAVEIAKNNPSKEVVFLGVGFETTTPGTAIAIEKAILEKVNNFSVLSMHKLVEPVLRALLSMEDIDIDGFICPGHVAVILGEDGFEFLSEEYKKPSVIAGFEAMDILTVIYRLLIKIRDNDTKLENLYTRAVSKHGNLKAKEIIFKYFEPYDDIWRGIGVIEKSGLKIKDKYKEFDAIKKYSIKITPSSKQNPCRCGEIIKGKMDPIECPLFAKGCTPENPIGPCMVSSEGACAAYYKYQRI